jgi:hypothetical protein
MEKPELEYTNKLKSLKEQNELTEYLCLQIKHDFPNTQLVCLDVELIKLICDKIEFLVKTKRLKKVDKKEFFHSVYLKLFDELTLNNNKHYLDNVIEYLHDNNLIASVSLISIGVQRLFKFFLK